MDFTMSRHRLRHLRPRILIPIVLPAVPDKHTPQLFDLLDQIPPLHATLSSATRRTAGISPLDKSR